MESRMRSKMLQLVGPAKLWVMLTLFLLPGVQSGAHPPHNDHIHHDQKDSGTEHGSLMNFQPILPVKFQFGVEYSVVSQDDFGKRALIKLNIIPVIGGLIQNPTFGGG
jgi:hypothetical protein